MLYYNQEIKMENKRWYDLEPTLSLAVSLIKNSDEETQIKCAEFIKDKAIDYGVVLNSNLIGAFDYFVNRWYDKREPLSVAFGYLKEAEDETKKQIALETIAFLEKNELKKYEI